MNILHISNKPIYPLIDGGCKAMCQMLRALMKTNKVNHICLSTHKHPFKKELYPKEILDLSDTQSIYVETRLNFFKALIHLLFNISYNFNRFYSHRANAIIQKQISENNYDVIVLDSLYSCAYIDVIKRNSNSKIIYRAHNVEHRIWKRLHSEEVFFLKRIYLNILSKQLKKVELNILKKVDAVWSISELDSLFFLDKTKHVSTLPMALEFKDQLKEYSNTDLFFIGAYNWKPNLDAVVWLANILLPKLHEKDPSLKLHLAGSFSNELESQITYRQNVFFHGFVNDSNEFMMKNGIFVMPIRTGSGVRIKALEAMSLGVPIIGTGVALEGISEGEVFLKAESIEQWVEKIQFLRASASKREELSINARELVKSKFDLNAIDQLIQMELERIVA